MDSRFMVLARLTLLLSIYDLLEQSDRKRYDKLREDETPSVILYLSTDCKGLFSKTSKKDISATLS